MAAARAAAEALEREEAAAHERFLGVKDAMERQAKADLEEHRARLTSLRDERIKRRPSDTQAVIAAVCDEIRDFLLDKNLQYGDSAIDPVRIFSKASPVEQLLVRIDDKLSRISRGDDRIESDDDVIDDLIGYLIMLKVARRKESSNADA